MNESKNLGEKFASRFFSNSLTAPKLKEGLMELSADRLLQIILHDFKFFSSIYMEGSKKKQCLLIWTWFLGFTKCN